MAITKFSVIKRSKDNGELLITEINREYTYKMAVEIAKFSTEKNWELIAVIETWKLYPNETKENKKNINMDNTK